MRNVLPVTGIGLTSHGLWLFHNIRVSFCKLILRYMMICGKCLFFLSRVDIWLQCNVKFKWFYAWDLQKLTYGDEYLLCMTW